jgi:DNA-binding response OmpR family regulator
VARQRAARTGAPAVVQPLPLLVLRRGPPSASERALAALDRDPRVALFYAAELTPKWVSLAQRMAATLVVANSDPLGELAYAATAGIRTPIVIAMPKRYKGEARELIEAGALACLTLPITTRDVARLLPLLAGTPSPVRIEPGSGLLLDAVSRVVRYADRTVQLSQREFAVLHCLSARQGKPVSASELLRTVWADRRRTGANRQILEVYIFHLRKKLKRLGIKNPITTVRGFGYSLPTV